MQDAAQEAYIARHELRWLLHELAAYAQVAAAAATTPTLVQTASNASGPSASIESTTTRATTQRHKARRRRRVSARHDTDRGETTATATHAQLCNLLCHYIDAVRCGEWLTQHYGAALSWSTHVRRHRRLGTALALTVTTTWRELAAPLYYAYCAQQQPDTLLSGTTVEDVQADEAASTLPAPRFFASLTSEASPSVRNESDAHTAVPRLADWAFLFLTAHCRDMSVQTWLRVLRLSRRSRTHQGAMQTLHASPLTAEAIVLRSLLLHTTDCSAHGTQLRRRIASHDTSHDTAALSDSQADVMPAWVLTELEHTYSTMHLAAHGGDDKENKDLLDTTFVLCDAYWLWSSEPYASMWATYYLRNSSRTSS